MPELSKEDQEALKGAEGITNDLPGGEKPAGAAESQPAQKAEDPSKENEKPDSAGPIKIDDVFGSQTLGDQEVKLSSFSDVQKFGKELGFEIKDVNDLQGVFKELTTLKGKTENLDQLQSQVKQYENYFKNVPKEVAAIYDAALANRDYIGVIKQIASNADLDYSKHFKDQDVLKLVNQFTGRSFDKEKFEALDEDTRTALTTVAEARYNDNRKSYQDSINDRDIKMKSYQENFDKSVKSSLEALRAKHPSFDEKALLRVEQIMRGGLQQSLFNEDNTYKPEAAVKIAMQEYGEQALEARAQTIGEIANRLRSKMSGQVHEQILNTNDNRDSRGKEANVSKDVLEAAVSQATDFLNV